MRSVKISSVRYRLQVETHNSTVRSRVLTEIADATWVGFREDSRLGKHS